VAALAGAGLWELAVSNCRHCFRLTSRFRQIVDVEVAVGVRRVEGPWHVSDENLPSDGSTTSPQGRADGTGEHYEEDVEKRVDEQGSSCGGGGDEGREAVGKCEVQNSWFCPGCAAKPKGASNYGEAFRLPAQRASGHYCVSCSALSIR
jgi:hypothetical protein